MDVQHRRRLEGGFVLPRVNAVDGTDVDTRGILRSNARFADDVRHAVLPKSVLPRSALLKSVLRRSENYTRLTEVDRDRASRDHGHDSKRRLATGHVAAIAERGRAFVESRHWVAGDASVRRALRTAALSFGVPGVRLTAPD